MNHHQRAASVSRATDTDSITTEQLGPQTLGSIQQNGPKTLSSIRQHSPQLQHHRWLTQPYDPRIRVAEKENCRPTSSSIPVAGFLTTASPRRMSIRTPRDARASEVKHVQAAMAQRCRATGQRLPLDAGRPLARRLVASLPDCLVAHRGLADGRRLCCSPHRTRLKRGGCHDDACIFRASCTYLSGEITPPLSASLFINPFIVQVS